MITLKNRHKAFIITRLACFEDPIDVQRAFEDRYGFKPSLNQITGYNFQDAKSNETHGQCWKELFDVYRKQYTDEVSETAIANKRYRLVQLQKRLEEMKETKNYPGAIRVLQQAAKEMGDAFTKREGENIKDLLQSLDLDQLNEKQLEMLAEGVHPLAVITLEERCNQLN